MRKDLPYYIPINEIIDFINNTKSKTILLQAPDGLKPLLYNIVEEVKNVLKDITIYVSGSHAYGACDLAIDEAKTIGADVIIHIGHNEYPYLYSKPEIPVLYIPAYYMGQVPYDLIEELIMMLEKLNARNIGLFASLQYIKLIPIIKQYLQKKGFNVLTSRSRRTRYLLEGQILGCDYTALDYISNDVDTYIILSGGYFHALGACLYKPFNANIILIDPHKETIESLNGYCKKIIAKRLFIVSKLINSTINRVVGITGVRPGQYRPGLLEFIEKKFIEQNIEFFRVISMYLTKESLAAIDHIFNADAYIVFSCPRLPIDDLTGFYKPVITPGEAFMVLHKSLEYRFPW